MANESPLTGNPRLTPELLAVAVRVREYWAARHADAARNVERQAPAAGDDQAEAERDTRPL